MEAEGEGAEKPLREISLETISYFIKEELGEDEPGETSLDEDMLTINLRESHSREILKKISDGYYLPTLCEFCIDNIEDGNEYLITLFKNTANTMDGLYINYKVNEAYQWAKIDIDPYFDALLSVIPHVRDRVKLRWFRMTLAQMVQIMLAGKHLNAIDFAFCAIDTQDNKDIVDFGEFVKYKIKNLSFYGWGHDFRGGLLTEDDFRLILQGIQKCKLEDCLKRISVLSMQIDDDTLRDMMEEYDLGHIKLTKDY